MEMVPLQTQLAHYLEIHRSILSMLLEEERGPSQKYREKRDGKESDVSTRQDSQELLESPGMYPSQATVRTNSVVSDL